MKKYIQVVAGVNIKYIDNKPHVLLGLKPRGVWELPGGKVEGNESHSEALEREWMEELGMEIDVEDERVGHALNGEYEVWFYEVEPQNDPDDRYASAKEHIEVKYVGLDEIKHLKMNAINKAILSKFEEY